MAVFVLALLLATHLAIVAALASTPTVIVIGAGMSVIGAGMSGISAAKTLSDAGIRNILILEAADRIGGEMHKTNFAGLSVELGANWVEGVHGPQMNSVWPIVNQTLKRKTFFTDYDNLSQTLPNNSYDPFLSVLSADFKKSNRDEQQVHQILDWL